MNFDLKNNLLIIFLSLLFWSCEDKKDSTPPTISVSNDFSEQIVSGISKIIVLTDDKSGIDKVEFIINDLLVSTDTQSPYEYDWNTNEYDNLSLNTLKVISYDNFNNFIEKEIFNIVVDNRVNIWDQYFDINTTTMVDLELFRVNLGELLPTPIPPQIGDLVNLKILNLNLNRLNETFPDELWNLSNLEELYLNDNFLSGNIPDDISKLINLNTISLMHNQFSGNIPSQIGSLGNLQKIFFNDNNFSGSIPEEFGNLINLTELRLKDNKLSGVIPHSLCNLNQEIFFNVLGTTNFSNNMFCPPYPECIIDFIGLQDTSNCN